MGAKADGNPLFQSLFVWILSMELNEYDREMLSILVRVDIMLAFKLISLILAFNPCSCGYYMDNSWIKAPSVLSILVRVDIILLFSPSMRITHNFSSYSVENAPPL